jgi:hypothetical protein
MLSGCITVWYGNCTTLNRKALQRVSASPGVKLLALHDTYSPRCHRKAEMIIKEINHTSHRLFTPLPLEGDVSTGASKLGPRD